VHDILEDGNGASCKAIHCHFCSNNGYHNNKIFFQSDADISALKHTPSGGFGSCRYKMKSLEGTPEFSNIL
jgi:hypothetical protein